MLFCHPAYARITTSVEVLKKYAYDSDRVVRHLAYLNSKSTEEIKLMVKAFNKFGHLKR